MGYGILKIEGNKPKLEAMGILQLNKYEDHYLRLRKIFERVLALIDQYPSGWVGYRGAFLREERTEYVETRKGTRSSDGGGLGAGYPDLRVRPSKIKLSITGNGNAAKEQVAGMLQRYLKIPDESMLPQLDATDGLAAAVCHYFQTNNPISEKKYTGWKDFIAKNPGKVRWYELKKHSYEILKP